MYHRGLMFDYSKRLGIILEMPILSEVNNYYKCLRTIVIFYITCT